MENFYYVLGLTERASQNEIKKSYKKLAMLYHPDRNKGDPQAFQRINQAYKILSNIDSRRRYDAEMKEAVVVNPREYVHFLWEKII
jgi:curved DNA-binding protein CbpA